MATIQIELDEQTMEIATRLSEQYHLSLEEILQISIKRLSDIAAKSVISSMEDDDVFDQVIEEIYRNRARDYGE